MASPAHAADNAYIITKNSDGSVVQSFRTDQANDVARALDKLPVPGAYTLTLNEDMDVTNSQEAFRSALNMDLTVKSGDGGPFKLTNSTSWAIWVLYASYNSKMTVENIIIDGSNAHQGFKIDGATNGVPGANVTLNNVTIQNSKNVETTIGGNNGGAGIVVGENATLTMTGGKLLNNYAPFITSSPTTSGSGGAMRVLPGATATLDGVTLTGNKADEHGGSIYNQGVLTIKNATISDSEAGVNSNRASGGAIDNSGGTLIIEKSTISNSSADEQGGAIYSNGQATITGCTITGGSAKYGGAIASQNDITVTDTTISGSKALSSGGGVAVYSGGTTLTNVTISENNAPYGGGFYGNGQSETTVTGGQITNNTATQGAGMRVGGTLKIDGTEISSNQGAGNPARSFGGGVYINGATATVTNANIHDNGATLGGGVYANGGTADFKNSKLSANYAAYAGGLSANNNAAVMLDAVTVEKNDAFYAGGVMLRTSQATIKAAKFLSNSAKPYQGGGLYVYADASANISEGTQFIGNTANWGGAIHLSDYQFAATIDSATAYRQAMIDSSTVFQENWAANGAFDPPTNYADFTNLQFARTSFTKADGTTELKPADSLINNYDISYKKLGFEPFHVLAVTYDANSGTGGKVEEIRSDEVPEYVIKDAAGASVEREGYTMTGWNTDAAAGETGTAYAPGAKVDVKALVESLVDPEAADGNEGALKNRASLTLYAQWSVATYQVIFETNGGTKVAAQTVEHGRMATLPDPQPTRDGYTFTGWFEDAALTQPFDFNTAIVKDATVYAGWQALLSNDTKTVTKPKKLPKSGSEAGLTSSIFTLAGVAYGAALLVYRRRVNK